MTYEILLALACTIVLGLSAARYESGWATTISGTVTDTEGQAVVGAQVTFTDEADPSRVFAERTNADGRYKVVLSEVTVQEEAEGEAAAKNFALFQNYPNPFNPSTMIPYRLGKTAHMRLVVYNVLGQQIRTLADGVQGGGSHTTQWDGYDDTDMGVGAGVYVVRMEAGRFVQSRKMAMVDGVWRDAWGRLQKPLVRSTKGSQERATFYTVTITGEDIVSFTQTEIAVSEDMVLDFVVQRKPYNMVLIPAGAFQMGDALNEGGSREQPVHTVTVDGFWMDKYEMTNAPYRAFCDATGHPYPPTSGSDWYDHVPATYVTEFPSCPTACVRWYDAVRYCNWRSRQEGLEECYKEDAWECDFTKNGYRLPTEAEWEYGARGGLEGKRYPWGDEDPYGCANYGAYDNSGEYRSDMIDFGYRNKRGPTPVGSYAANGYALHDMAGNVAEWCNDWFDPDYYSTSPESNPTGPESWAVRDHRVLRGGSWSLKASFVLCAYRGTGNPGYRSNAIGFRCVRRVL